MTKDELRQSMLAEPIEVDHVFPPIPVREFDYAAYRRDYDLGRPVGRGPTPEAATQDLLELEEEMYEQE